jgi:hypothetical protein
VHPIGAKPVRSIVITPRPRRKAPKLLTMPKSDAEVMAGSNHAAAMQPTKSTDPAAVASME